MALTECCPALCTCHQPSSVWQAQTAANSGAKQASGCDLADHFLRTLLHHLVTLARTRLEAPERFGSDVQSDTQSMVLERPEYICIVTYGATTRVRSTALALLSIATAEQVMLQHQKSV